MRIISGTTQFRIEEGTAVAIGKFDGLHLGHRRLLEEILRQKEDGLAAAVFALAICLLQEYLGRTELNTAAFNLVISLLIGLGVGLLAALLPALHMDKILIGDIMLLIPGLAMTNAVRNMLVGDTISGAVRLAESLIWAVALASGFMIALMIVRALF